MNFKQFKEEFKALTSDNDNGFYYAHTLGEHSVSIRYDPRLNSFDIYAGKSAKCILDGTDLRTSKAFIKLTEMEKNK